MTATKTTKTGTRKSKSAPAPEPVTLPQLTTPAPAVEPKAPPVVEKVTNGRQPKHINSTQAAAMFGTAAAALHAVGWL